MPSAPSPPIVPTPPAWASIRVAPTGVPGRRPSASAACGARPEPSSVPGSTTAADLLAVVGEQVGKPDPLEVAWAPTPLVGEIGPLACHRARRSGEASRCAKAQIVGEVEEVPGISPGCRQMLLQPEQFRRLHFGRDDPAHVPQDLVLGCAYALGLRDRPVIHPDDDVALRVARGADAQGISCAVEHDERTGGIEAHALHESGRERRLLQDIADCPAHAFQMSVEDCSTMSPLRARRRSADGPWPKNPLGVEETGAGAGRADVDTDESLLHTGTRLASDLLTSMCSHHRRGRYCRSSGSRRPMRGTARPTRSPRLRRGGPSAFHRSRHHTWRDWT